MPETIPVNKIDRTGWPTGERDQETEDRLDFEHAGLACLLLRGPMGAWCGYVGVGPDHPFHGKSYDDIDVDVHGGLTYADKCGGSICHVPKPGMPADVWWFGFDTAHSGDIVPRMLASDIKLGLPHIDYGFPQSYKNIDYAKRETERLAKQLTEVTA